MFFLWSLKNFNYVLLFAKWMVLKIWDDFDPYIWVLWNLHLFIKSQLWGSIKSLSGEHFHSFEQNAILFILLQWGYRFYSNADTLCSYDILWKKSYYDHFCFGVFLHCSNYLHKVMTCCEFWYVGVNNS